MCGRTACTLAPDVICRACSYKDPSSSGSDSAKYSKPRWRDHPPSKEGTSYTYYPSANVAPTRFTPVMVSSQKLITNGVKQEGEEDEEEAGSGRDVMPMMFGMIPHYHKGEAKSHGLSTNNCRLEGLLESKLYKRAWNMRKFCVVLGQGFYEWKTTGGTGEKGKKQPYLIYMPQESAEEDKKMNVVDNEVWEASRWSEEEGWDGPNILKMAGLFDVWKSPAGDEVYSYTIITMESNETLSWLHHRMPAILDNEEQVNAWLNATPDTPAKELLSILKPTKSLQWHPVDPKVGNSRCHDLDCMQPVELDKKKPNTFMDNWLKRTPAAKVKAEEPSEGESESKKAKKK